MPATSSENTALEPNTAANNSTSINDNDGSAADTPSTAVNVTETKLDAEVVAPLPNKESATETDLRQQLSLTEAKLHAASVILSERERQLEVRSEEQARAIDSLT